MNGKEVGIPERVKCEKCESESAILIKVLSTKEEPKRRKKEEQEILIYLKDALILVYECQKCGSKFDKIIRKNSADFHPRFLLFINFTPDEPALEILLTFFGARDRFLNSGLLLKFL